MPGYILLYQWINIQANPSKNENTMEIIVILHKEGAYNEQKTGSYFVTMPKNMIID